MLLSDVAFEGTLVDEDSGSVVDQSKVGVTRSSINGALVFESEYMIAGKGLMLPDTQRPRSGSIEVAETQLLQY